MTTASVEWLLKRSWGRRNSSGFSPKSLPNLSIWLNSQSNPISGGNLAWADQSGLGNNAAQAATVWSYVPAGAAGSGVPAHLAYAGGSNSLITGTLNAALAAGKSYSFYCLRQLNTTNARGNIFKNSGNNVVIGHDNFGTPGRTYLQHNGGAILSINDNDVAWIVETVVWDVTTPLATVYESNAPIGSLNVGDTGGLTGYLVAGASQYVGGDDARSIAELLLYWGVAHTAAQQTNVFNFLQKRIP